MYDNVSKLITGLRQTIANYKIALNTAEREEEKITKLLDLCHELGHNVYLSTDVNGRVSIIIYAQVPGFTTEAAPDLLRLMENIESTLDVEVARNSDNPDDNNRTYWFRSTNFDVTLSADLVEGAACQRVIVGTRKRTISREEEIEVPVYEFKC